jgi:copper chaperone CopZ
MKKITIIISIFALCTLHIAQTFAQTPEKKQEQTSNKTTVTLYLNFHCQGCVNRLDKGLPFVKGVVDYVTKLSDKSVKVTFRNDKTNIETIKKEIEKMDFIVADSPEGLDKK